MAGNDYKNEDLATSVKEHEKFSRNKGSDKPIDKVINGSMAPDMAEIKRLGDDMQDMKTEQELSKRGMVDDPKQND
ncbi:hypothetical protein [Paenibacillus xerothermodurans]|uniref:Uncharacterized protein n=1 Tax=Paenibacillus xerothermodurans TaxID=1977292 RepID=A0A2W1NYI5_PAEXE|nr:hypothetical protein [Paenibacillus xerothermodurans]PZE22796.1 hypothetical protein CBW46_003270 [Paenibacillus xerothermodurans]